MEGGKICSNIIKCKDTEGSDYSQLSAFDCSILVLTIC